MFFPKTSRFALAILFPLVAHSQPPSTATADKAPPRKVLGSQHNEPMVDIAKTCPGICIELRYTTERNIAGKAIYPPHALALIRRSVADRLRRVQDELHKLGFGLKIWDAYRPAWAHDLLWKAVPDPEHLVAPSRGGSYHTWGIAVDVTLVDLQGHEVKMASDFDDFTDAAKSFYVGNDPTVATHMVLLRTAMINAGFRGIRDEWWHFSAEDAAVFAPVDMPLEEGGSR